MSKKTKTDKELVNKVAMLISKQLTKADWMASFWDEIDEIKDTDVILERQKLLKVAGEIIKVVKDGLNKKESGQTIEDGFGSVWSTHCSECGKETLAVIGPGKVRCTECES